VFVGELNPPLYYVMNYIGKNIFVYNEYWEYQRTITPPNVEYASSGPTYSLNDNGNIYIAADNVINKYDKYLNLSNQVIYHGANRGIYLNPLNQLIYVSRADTSNNDQIKLFNKDLNLTSNLNIDYTPWFLTGYNETLVVADQNTNNIHFHQNNTKIKTIQTLCNNRINSILFDNYNHILVLCESPANMYIYHLNGSYTGLNMSTCRTNTKSWFVNFDSKDRLVVLCHNLIEIYY
jgi:hypothetical protein